MCSGYGIEDKDNGSVKIMVRQTMEEKINDILNANACSYSNTQGNDIYFFTKSITPERSGDEYKQEARINTDDTLTWECECLAFTHSREEPKSCKHIGSAKEVLKNDSSIRTHYVLIEGDDSG